MFASPDYDQEYLHYALEELERYLLSDELFWPVLARPSSGGSFLKLTLGNLLLSLKKQKTLQQGRQLTRLEETELDLIQSEIETVQRRWPVAWEAKAGREFRSRFTQWSHILNDLIKDYRKQAPYYQSEVRLRVLLQILSEHTPGQTGYDLVPLDTILRGLWSAGRFIWPPQLERGFPRGEYWFLYGELRDQ
ncbi:MAG: hypothetical protein JW757_13195 [Anaerolineales bacterium]|nr:hypothetical protein [Anaerolineales bacterium]